MKTKVLALAVIMSLNVAAPAFAGDDLSARQQQLLQLIEEQGPKAALRSMSNEELIAAKNDLRDIVSSLRTDLTIAEQRDGDRLGYTVRKVGVRGVGVVVLLSALLIVSDNFGPMAGKSMAVGGGGGAMVAVMLGIPAAALMAATAVSGQAIIWFTPSEAEAVQDRLDSVVKALDIMDARLAK